MRKQEKKEKKGEVKIKKEKRRGEDKRGGRK